MLEFKLLCRKDRALTSKALSTWRRGRLSLAPSGGEGRDEGARGAVRFTPHCYSQWFLQGKFKLQLEGKVYGHWFILMGCNESRLPSLFTAFITLSLASLIWVTLSALPK